MCIGGGTRAFQICLPVSSSSELLLFFLSWRPNLYILSTFLQSTVSLSNYFLFQHRFAAWINIKSCSLQTLTSGSVLTLWHSSGKTATFLMPCIYLPSQYLYSSKWENNTQTCFRFMRTQINWVFIQHCLAICHSPLVVYACSHSANDYFINSFKIHLVSIHFMSYTVA